MLPQQNWKFRSSYGTSNQRTPETDGITKNQYRVVPYTASSKMSTVPYRTASVLPHTVSRIPYRTAREISQFIGKLLSVVSFRRIISFGKRQDKYEAGNSLNRSFMKINFIDHGERFHILTDLTNYHYFSNNCQAKNSISNFCYQRSSLENENSMFFEMEINMSCCWINMNNHSDTYSRAWSYSNCTRKLQSIFCVKEAYQLVEDQHFHENVAEKSSSRQ